MQDYVQGSPQAQQNIFHILELTQRIGSYLQPFDLFACIQVSKNWNSTLIPLLWSTIDDSILSWPIIVKRHDENLQHNNTDNKNWVHLVFVKYGCHIRHLRLHWRTTLDAACSGNHCSSLLSLFVGRIRHSNVQHPEHEWMADLDRNEQDEMIELRWIRVMNDFITSSTILPFPKRGIPFGRTLAQQELDWVITKHFWRFLRRNQKLQSLHLDKSLTEFMEEVSPPYFIDALASLKDLSVFENNYIPIELTHIAVRLSQLKIYGTIFPPSIRETHEVYSQQLVKASFLSSISFQTLLNILRLFPNLEFMNLGGIMEIGRVTSREASVIMNKSPSRLSAFKLFIQPHLLNANFDAVFTWTPHLTTVVINRLIPSVALALCIHCTALETVVETFKGPILGTQDPNAEDNTLALSTFLKYCPTLKKFDGIRHVLCGQIWEESWVCLNLIFLRCQIRGVQRLSVQDQERYDALVRTGDKIHLEGNRGLMALHQASLSQQKSIYRRLATLKKLRILNLGARHRPFSETTRLRVPEVDFLFDDGPIHDTLELSLESGLEELRTLNELQVFGFEGVNHNIEYAELQWMAKAWPKLDEMHGLYDSFPVKCDYDGKKCTLQEIFVKLRPDVKHIIANNGSTIIVPRRAT